MANRLRKYLIELNEALAAESENEAETVIEVEAEAVVYIEAETVTEAEVVLTAEGG